MSLFFKVIEDTEEMYLSEWIKNKDNIVSEVRSLINDIKEDNQDPLKILGRIRVLFYRSKIKDKEDYDTKTIPIMTDGLREEFIRNLKILAYIEENLRIHNNVVKDLNPTQERIYNNTLNKIRDCLTYRILPVLEIILETTSLTLNHAKKIETKTKIDKSCNKLLEKIKSLKNKLLKEDSDA